MKRPRGVKQASWQAGYRRDDARRGEAVPDNICHGIESHLHDHTRQGAASFFQAPTHKPYLDFTPDAGTECWRFKVCTARFPVHLRTCLGFRKAFQFFTCFASRTLGTDAFRRPWHHEARSSSCQLAHARQPGLGHHP